MLRRDFFATCIVTPLLGFTEGIGLTKPREYVDPDLGKCLSHTLESHIDREYVYEIGRPDPYMRYIQFPNGFQIQKYKFLISHICVFSKKKEDDGNQA